MDMCMVDVTDLPEVTEGSVAVIYGHTENGGSNLWGGATVMNTISLQAALRSPAAFLGSR